MAVLEALLEASWGTSLEAALVKALRNCHDQLEHDPRKPYHP